MEILRVASDLYPYITGGNAIHAHEMSAMQAEMGHRVTVFTLPPRQMTAPEPAEGYVRVEYPVSFRVLGNSFNPRLLVDLMKGRNHYDIIHAHSHLYLSTNFCAAVKKFGSAPLIITNHGIMSSSAPEWVNNGYMRTLGRATLNAADRIICYTPLEKQRFVDEFGIDQDKIELIPNGIDPGMFSPAPHPNGDERTVLFIGRLVPGKGAHFLIEAAHILRERYPDLKFVLVGDGPGKPEIENLIARYGLQESVSLRDFSRYDEMPDIYRRSSIFVLPSLYEGVPRTMLEAMSCGLPVIISDFPHLKDIVQNAGLMFPKGDVRALVDAVATVLEDENMARDFGRNGRYKVINNYSWRKTVELTCKLYEDTLESINLRRRRKLPGIFGYHVPEHE